MADALAFMIVIVPLFAQDVPIAVGMTPRFAFLTDVVGAAHEGIAKEYNSQIFRSIGANVASARNIVYQYSDNIWADDLEIDLTGELTFKKGDIILRRGKNWKIDSVHSEQYINDPRMTIWVYLVDVLVN
jgi:hypothetical protein